MNAAIDTPMAGVNAWGWQGSYKTIKERTTYMLDHSPIPFNVKFKIGRPDREAVIIEAHKDVLAIGSEVFHAMFYGGLATNEETIEISDTDPAAFRLVIRYLYTEDLFKKDDIALAFEVMKCAGKYGVPYLYIQCRQWIVQHFVQHFDDKANVKSDALPYLQMALKVEYEDQKIQEALWSEIDLRAESVLQTPDDILRNVNLDVLNTFLARDTLTILKERDLYDFMIRWAKLQTAEGETAGSTMAMRERLGDAIKHIRYSRMHPAEFSNGPVADNVVTREEAALVYQYQFSAVTDQEFTFDNQPRKSTRARSPTTLAVKTAFFNGSPRRSKGYNCEPFAHSTIQMAELHPALMSVVRELETPAFIGVSKATCSFVEESNSFLSTLTVRFGKDFLDAYSKARNFTWMEYQDLDDEQRKVLEESAGRVLKLGLGDVAVEVEVENDVHMTITLGDEEENEGRCARLQSISLVFGGYSSCTYTSVKKGNSVFYLGRIVNGTTDFSFLRHFVQPGQLLPTCESVSFSTKKSADVPAE